MKLLFYFFCFLLPFSLAVSYSSQRSELKGKTTKRRHTLNRIHHKLKSLRYETKIVLFLIVFLRFKISHLREI